MHTRLLITAAKALALAAFLFAGTPPSPVSAQADMDVSVFYDELEAHGRWFSHPRYGYVWSPDVDEDWRPYSRGHWIYTDDHGWYWEAEETWGWGPFHYGRWIMDDEFGWVWIPGTEWGPAWVAWRYSDEYVGWAPLPPEAEWYEDRGLAFSATYYDQPRFAPLWIFVQPRYLILPGLYRYALPRSRNVFALGRTRWHTDYRFVNRRIFNTGFDVRHFERITRRPVVRVRLITSDSPRVRGFRDNDRGTLQTYRPRLVAGPNPPRPPRLVDPPRREFRHQDGSRPAAVRPGFTPQDLDKSRPPREEQFRRQRPGEASGSGPPPDFKKQEFKPPQTGMQTPPGQPNGEPRFRRGENRQPNAGEQPPPRQRIQGDTPPRPQQFRQQGGAPREAGGGQPPPQRGGDRNQGDAKKGKPDKKDDTIAR